MIEVDPEESVLCVIESFSHCPKESEPDHMFLKAAMAASECVQKYIDMRFDVRDGLLQFYEEHMKKKIWVVTHICHPCVSSNFEMVNNFINPSPSLSPGT